MWTALLEWIASLGVPDTFALPVSVAVVLVAGLVCALLLLGGMIAGVTLYMVCGKPTLPGPPFGTMGQRFKQRREKVFVEVLQEVGALSTIFEGWLVTADPALVKDLLNSKVHTEHRSRLYKWSKWLLPGLHGVLNMDGEEWLRHTRALLQVFHSSHISQQSHIVAAAVTRHTQAWLRGVTATRGVLPHVDSRVAPAPPAATGGPCLLTAIRGIGMDAILSIGFGLQPGTDLADALAKDMSLYPELVGNFSQLSLARVLDFLELQRCTARIQSLTAKALGQLPTADEADREPFKYNFLSQMAGAKFSLLETAREVNHIHGAHKAASFVVTCALHTLTRHPQWIQRLRGEWMQVLGGGSPDPAQQRHPTFADTERMPLSMAVIAECLRLHVVSLGVVRQTGAPLTVQGKTMPAGTEVVILLQALHTHPQFWGEDAEHFDPNRFLQDGKCDVGPFERKFTYIPFLRGRRMCAGKALAELELLVVLHGVLSTVDMKVGGGEHLLLKDDMYAALDETLPFTVTPLTTLDAPCASGPATP